MINKNKKKVNQALECSDLSLVRWIRHLALSFYLFLPFSGFSYILFQYHSFFLMVVWLFLYEESSSSFKTRFPRLIFIVFEKVLHFC